jgi:hypothetical protein
MHFLLLLVYLFNFPLVASSEIGGGLDPDGKPALTQPSPPHPLGDIGGGLDPNGSTLEVSPSNDRSSNPRILGDPRRVFLPG